MRRLVAALALVGCSTSKLDVPCPENTLAAVARAADSADGWRVLRETDTHVELVEEWPAHSAFMLGATGFHAVLDHEDGRLGAEFWLESRGVMTLGIANRSDLEDSFFGGALKPEMRRSASRVLGWAGVPMEDRPPIVRVREAE